MSPQLTWEGSVPFKFIVDSRPVYVHRGLISALSQPLNCLINGDFSEAQNEEAELTGVEYETFCQFVQWAYSGHYTSPEPASRLAEQEPGGNGAHEKAMSPPEPEVNEDFLQTEPIDFDDRWGSFTMTKAKKKSKTATWDEHGIYEGSRQKVSEKYFKGRLKSFKGMSFLASGDTEPPSQQLHRDAQNEDLTNVLLSHAKMYVFAEEKDIQPLKRCALHGLHQILCHFVVTPSSAAELANLILYVYHNTVQDSHKQEPMRSLISRYVGSVMNQLVATKEFQEVFQNADFISDFCSKLDECFAFCYT